MKLSELFTGQKIIIQMAWGEKKLEFYSEILETTDKGVFVTPYMHQDSPLDLTINNESRVTCSLFTDSPIDHTRISWRNIELETVERNDEKVYLITTNGFNTMSNLDERRKQDRVVVHINGRVCDQDKREQFPIIIHDISDVGISFFTAPSFKPPSNQFIVSFADKVNDNVFNLKVECALVRSYMSGEVMFWGCKTVGENKEFLLYSFMLRLVHKNQTQTEKQVQLENLEQLEGQEQTESPEAAEAPEAQADYVYKSLDQIPEMKEEAAQWFSDKWGVPKEDYLDCMEAFLKEESKLGWYVCMDGTKIIAGLGVIENDFHDRKDLSPNVCAVYTEEAYRGQRIAGNLLDMVVEDCKQKGISPLYLLTDHTGFYERYGWEYVCMAQGDGEPEMSRMYMHK